MEGPIRIVDGKVVLINLTWVWRSGMMIQLCEPGNAEGCFDLRNRGRAIEVEITAWPLSKTENSFTLTTGGHDPHHLVPTCAELAMIASMSPKESDFQMLMDTWREDQLNKVRIERERHLNQLKKLRKL